MTTRHQDATPPDSPPPDIWPQSARPFTERHTIRLTPGVDERLTLAALLGRTSMAAIINTLLDLQLPSREALAAQLALGRDGNGHAPRT